MANLTDRTTQMRANASAAGYTPSVWNGELLSLLEEIKSADATRLRAIADDAARIYGTMRLWSSQPASIQGDCSFAAQKLREERAAIAERVWVAAQVANA